MLEHALETLAPWSKGQIEPERRRMDITIGATDLVMAVQALCDTHWGYLSAITGLDSGAQTNELEVLYHFCEGADVLTLRVNVPREGAEVSSICGVIPSAWLYEQELRELFGVAVRGLPDTGYVFLPDDWHEGEYPLLKTDVKR